MLAQTSLAILHIHPLHFSSPNTCGQNCSPLRICFLKPYAIEQAMWGTGTLCEWNDI